MKGVGHKLRDNLERMFLSALTNGENAHNRSQKVISQTPDHRVCCLNKQTKTFLNNNEHGDLVIEVRGGSF